MSVKFLAVLKLWNTHAEWVLQNLSQFQMQYNTYIKI